MLPTARHRCNISSNGAVLPGRNDAEMGPANSLHASAYYSEYNERFDLLFYSQISFCYREDFFFRTTVLLGGSSVKKLTEL